MLYVYKVTFNVRSMRKDTYSEIKQACRFYLKPVIDNIVAYG